MQTIGSLLLILDSGFTGDNLKSLADAGTKVASPTSPGALALVCHISASISDWWGKAVDTTDAEAMREIFEAPLRSVLEALDSGSREECWVAADHLADLLSSSAL